MRELLKHSKKILIGGHRGCECRYPENSIAAMEEGLRQGADYLEIDVQLSKDGKAVIVHDVKPEKGGLTGYVHEHGFSELKAAIPGLCTLREALEWGKEKGAWFGLELKTVPYDMKEANRKLLTVMTEELRLTGMTERVFAFGADYQILKELKAQMPELMLGLIVPFVPADPVKLMKEMEAEIYLSYVWNMEKKIVTELHEAGYYVDGAILKEERWINIAREIGVDMYETDFPGIEAARELAG